MITSILIFNSLGSIHSPNICSIPNFFISYYLSIFSVLKIFLFNSIIMDPDPIEKKMSSTNRKQKIFNVRRVNNKQFEQQRCAPILTSDLKPHLSPLQKKQRFYQPPSQKLSKKQGHMNMQMPVLTSGVYKELHRKYMQAKQQHWQQKEVKLKELKERDQQLEVIQQQKAKLAQEREKLQKRCNQLRSKIQKLRSRNEIMRNQQEQRNAQYRFLNMQYLRDMIISMRYQNGINIDIDRMSYQQLLQLQQQIGSVNKGLTEDIINKLPQKQYSQSEKQQLCSICYSDIRKGQVINKLNCQHIFHFQCLKEWLLKQKVCPMCKRQIELMKHISTNQIEQIQKQKQ